MATSVVEAQVRERCEQILVEGRPRRPQLDLEQRAARGQLSPTAFTAALLPRHLLHATMQKRLAQKLGAPNI